MNKSLISFSVLLLIFAACSHQRPREADHQPSVVESKEYSKSAIEDSLRTDAIGALVYVPVYSDIFSTHAKRKVLLTVTMSIHNTNLDKPLEITHVDYYDANGKLLRHYIESPIVLSPLQTVNYIVEYKESKGGSGANFIVEWHGARNVNAPIIEAVMISTESTLGISFITEGKVIANLD